MLKEDQWNVFANGAEKIAGAVKTTYGIKTVFHIIVQDLSKRLMKLID